MWVECGWAGVYVLKHATLYVLKHATLSGSRAGGLLFQQRLAVMIVFEVICCPFILVMLLSGKEGQGREKARKGEHGPGDLTSRGRKVEGKKHRCNAHGSSHKHVSFNKTSFPTSPLLHPPPLCPPPRSEGDFFTCAQGSRSE